MHKDVEQYLESAKHRLLGCDDKQAQALYKDMLLYAKDNPDTTLEKLQWTFGQLEDVVAENEPKKAKFTVYLRIVLIVLVVFTIIALAYYSLALIDGWRVRNYGYDSFFDYIKWLWNL